MEQRGKYGWEGLDRGKMERGVAQMTKLSINLKKICSLGEKKEHHKVDNN